jgi:uncharacterized protein (DUF1697 family)
MPVLTTYVALIRGVNVGGSTPLPMAGLRATLASLGLAGPATYLQSGNAVFGSQSRDASRLAAAIEQQIAAELGASVSVVLRTPGELRTIVGGNPFPEAAADPARLHVVFLAAVPERDALATLDPDRSPPDEFRARGSEIYVRYPNGSGRSKLTLDYFERRLGVRATARNWNTVTKLLELASSHGAQAG